MNIQHKTATLIKRPGVTLVEILVVITIMSVLTLLIVPRVRTINKDRNIRETARVVGSMFANASQRAAADGKNAGVLIKRNGNFVDSNFQDSNNRAISYAGTTLYMMRAVPDFTGDDDDAGVWLSPTTSADFICRIAQPLDHDQNAGEYVVRVNDRIFLKNQRYGYRVMQVDEKTVAMGNLVLDLTLDTHTNNGISRSTYPRPVLPNESLDVERPFGIVTRTEGSLAFRIERRPRVIASSAVDLPSGYQIDLRYSGWFNAMNNAVRFMSVDDVDENTDIEVVFNETGGIEDVRFDANASITPTNSLFLFVTEDDLNLGQNQDPLVRDSNLWVTVGNHNGGTGIFYNASPGEFVDNTNLTEMRTRITNARYLATFREDAAQ